MFTGLITDIGEVIARIGRPVHAADGLRAAARGSGCRWLRRRLPDGDLDQADRQSGAEFTVDVSNETLAKTTLADWSPAAASISSGR